LVFVGKSFSDKLFVWAIVKDLPYHTNLGRESAAFGALGFSGVASLPWAIAATGGSSLGGGAVGGMPRAWVPCGDFFGGGGVLEIGSWGCHIAPRGRIGTQDDPYAVVRADSNGTGRASVGSPLVA
jgi:hypothetical protein